MQNAVVTTLTHQRKDALMHKKDALAHRIDEILGEMRGGPEPLLPDTTQSPEAIRSQFTRTRDTSAKHEQLEGTSEALIKGRRIDSYDSFTRQDALPVMKTKRTTERSRIHYPTQKVVEDKIDEVIEYSNDSRRIGPRLLKLQEMERRLNVARDDFDKCRTKALFQKQQFDEIEKDAHGKLEDHLKDELLEHGSHVPTTLPLEYSHFADKTLDTRVREQKAARVRKYEDAEAFHADALKKEKADLQHNQESFTRAFNLNREHLMRKQQTQRDIFKDRWTIKRDKMLHDVYYDLRTAKSAVDHLEKELEFAGRAADGEFDRIRGRVRRRYPPILARPKGRGDKI
jgi:hypothetical protein